MSDSEDDFVTFGNALEPLDADNLPRKKPVSIEEQCAYDAQGRRRFHGAFTGGFSAGYFNSVGSRDGWRPQQFKSTRSSKAGNVVQKPEDFMDEEDTGEFGIAPTAIRATKDYSDQVNKGLKRERNKQDSTGPIPGTPVLKEILKPVRERVGVMLLKKLGWKPGQGVGPRLTKKEKRQKEKREKTKIYGCFLPNQHDKKSDSESESSDDDYANITFAPDDYEPFRCNPKDNYFGIGYSGLDRRSILSEHINLFDAPTFSVQDKNKKLSIRGQAFGVGAFETEDDDIYSREDMSNYDFALGPERKSKSRWSKEIKSKTDCIEGFVRSKQQFSQQKIFPAPSLPKDFQPIHKVRKSRFSPAADENKDKSKRYEMNAESRAKIINDDRPSIIDSKTLESKNTSVAAKLITRTLNLHGREQVAERQRMEQNTPKKSAMSWLDKISSTTFIKGETIGNDPKILGSLQSADVFSSNSNVTDSVEDTNLVKPTFADLDKQGRFEQFLNFTESERKLKFSSVQPLSMTEWERDQEVEEFEKAAQIHEKIDSLLKTQSENSVKNKEAETAVDLESLSLEDRMTTAAKMKMFGKFTRTSEEWKPAKLVCNRFNIAEPFVGIVDDVKKKKKFSIFDSMAWNEVSKFEKGKNLEYECEPMPSTSTSSSFAKKRPEHKIQSNFDDTVNKEKPVTEKEKAFEENYEKVFGKSVEKNKVPEIEKTETESNEVEESVPKVNIQEKKDLFKSIFLSSSEDESEVEETSINEEKLKVALIGKDPAEINKQRNTSPPRGVFAKLDLDSLMKRPEKRDTLKESSVDEVEKNSEVEKLDSNIEKQDCKEKMEEDNLPEDAYGPVLPKGLPEANDALGEKPLFTLSNKSLKLEDGVWVEKSRDKKKSKKEKKKHKHKERSRSKSRKKSKKEKRH